MKDKAIPFMLGFVLGHKGTPIVVHGAYLTIITLLLLVMKYHH
jgi:hypothetical protein